MSVQQAFMEAWPDRMLRLALELKELRAETEFAPSDDKRWRTWTPLYRSLRSQIDQHLRTVPE